MTVSHLAPGPDQPPQQRNEYHVIWHAHIVFTTTNPMDEDTPFDITDALAKYSPSMSVSRNLAGGGITICVDADNIGTATTDALSIVATALAAESLDWTFTELKVQNEYTFTAELDTPLYPEVVGYAEIAKMAGVSRQRARQFAEKPSFPAPVIETAQGPLMNKHAIERWLETRTAS